MAEANATETQQNIQRTADYTETYANNVHYESSVWDLKVLLGRLDQSSGLSITKQFLGVSIPWMQVKLMIHHLQVNLTIHEAYNGPVAIRNDLLPKLPQVTDEQLKDPLFKATVEKIAELHNKFLSSLQHGQATER